MVIWFLHNTFGPRHRGISPAGESLAAPVFVGLQVMSCNERGGTATITEPSIRRRFVVYMKSPPGYWRGDTGNCLCRRVRLPIDKFSGSIIDTRNPGDEIRNLIVESLSLSVES